MALLHNLIHAMKFRIQSFIVIWTTRCSELYNKILGFMSSLMPPLRHKNTPIGFQGLLQKILGKNSDLLAAQTSCFAWSANTIS